MVGCDNIAGNLIREVPHGPFVGNPWHLLRLLDCHHFEWLWFVCYWLHIKNIWRHINHIPFSSVTKFCATPILPNILPKVGNLSTCFSFYHQVWTSWHIYIYIYLYIYIYIYIYEDRRRATREGYIMEQLIKLLHFAIKREKCQLRKIPH